MFSVALWHKISSDVFKTFQDTIHIKHLMSLATFLSAVITGAPLSVQLALYYICLYLFIFPESTEIRTDVSLHCSCLASVHILPHHLLQYLGQCCMPAGLN